MASFATKAGMFLDALNSTPVRKVRDQYRGNLCTPLLEKKVVAHVRAAMVAVLVTKGATGEEADEVVDALVLCRHRADPTRYAFAMKEQMTPEGDDPSGEWELVT